MSAWEPAPHHLAYRTTLQNIGGLVAGRPDAADRLVPACPGWTVRDAVAHLVEICWKVDRRMAGQKAAPLPADLSVDDLLDRWNEPWARVEKQVADGVRDDMAIMMMDAFTHELDLRSALGVPAPDEHPAYCGALNLVNGGFAAAVRDRGLPALRLETPDAHWLAGPGEPAATVSGGRHDLMRSLTGRRTLDQIGRLSWQGPGPAGQWSPAFAWGPFHPPAEPVEEHAAV